MVSRAYFTSANLQIGYMCVKEIRPELEPFEVAHIFSTFELLNFEKLHSSKSAHIIRLADKVQQIINIFIQFDQSVIIYS